MTNIVIGNIIALIASIIMVYSGHLKQKNRIVYVQTIQIILSVISNIVLGGITGAIINILSCIRNILCYKEKLDLKAKITLVSFSAVLSLSFNNLGVIGLLPLISTIVYTLFIDIKDVVKFKHLIIFTMLMWLIYDIYIKSYTSACFEFVNIIINLIAIIQINRKLIYKNN